MGPGMGLGPALPMGCSVENKKAAESGSSPPTHLSQPWDPFTQALAAQWWLRRVGPRDPRAPW